MLFVHCKLSEFHTYFQCLVLQVKIELLFP